MEKIRVLIADDSVVYRTQIRAALAALNQVEIAGVAANGRIACDMLSQSKVDLLILDLEMPEMDGLQTLAEIKRRGHTGTKVLMFSSFSKRGAEITLEALRSGANDFIAKPGPGAADLASGGQPSDRIRELLEPKLRALFPEVGSATLATPAAPISSVPMSATRRDFNWASFRPELVVIGASTGGPTALELIFSKLAKDVACPILIAQHMPPIFTLTFAERLQRISGIPTREAKNGEPLSSGHAYVAPGDFHMVLSGKKSAPIIQLNKEPQEHFVRPAVDPLFRSAAEIFGDGCLAIILTGMGADGRLGCERIRSAGGPVIIQSKESSAVFGMPGAVFAANAYDKIQSPEEIAMLLNEKIAISANLARVAGGQGQ